MMINDNHALNPSVFKNIPYDSVKDFAPIGFVGYTPLILAANPNVPAKDVKELVALAKTKPDAVTYASVGVGSAQLTSRARCSGRRRAQRCCTSLIAAAHRRSTICIAGHVNTLFVSPVVGLPHIQAGKLKALALAATQRLEVLPDVPTMAEAGYPVEASYWFGLVAPAGTPPAVLAKLEKALADVLAMPDVRKRLTDMGAVVEAAQGQGVRRLHPRRDHQVGGHRQQGRREAGISSTSLGFGPANPSSPPGRSTNTTISSENTTISRAVISK